MPVLVACPSCGVALNVPENMIGLKVRCATCSTAFTANEPPPDPAPSQPLGEDRYREGQSTADPPERGWRDDDRRDDDRPPRDYDDDYDTNRRYIRRDLLPHRGSMIMTMGIISIVISTVGALICGLFGGFIAIGLGITAVLMGRGDLRQIDAGSMDPDGRGQTKSGIICGIVGMVLGTLIVLLCGVWLVFWIFIMSKGP
jgi:hypothetical protein